MDNPKLLHVSLLEPRFKTLHFEPQQRRGDKTPSAGIDVRSKTLKTFAFRAINTTNAESIRLCIFCCLKKVLKRYTLSKKKHRATKTSRCKKPDA
jgi:hypothetical protein